MPFPKIERVKYRKSPLENVICQLRFPPILSIDSEMPYLFQERIREEFPNFEEKLEIQQEVDINNKVINPLAKLTPIKNYEFSSINNMWKINLTRTFMSISTKQYSTWEEMLKWLEKPLSALNGIYKPAYFTRVGLRYIDIFCRSKLGLENSDWSELIQPYCLGMLGSEVAESLTEMSNIYEILCDDKSSRISIKTDLVRRVDTNEQGFAIDSDVYTLDTIRIEDLTQKLEYLHERSSRLLRFVITDKLHQRMEPENI